MSTFSEDPNSGGAAATAIGFDPTTLYPADWVQYWTMVLQGVNAPLTPTNFATGWNWSRFESGPDVLRWNNSLNTTQDAPGAVSENSVGVKSYPDIATGAAATVQTLTNGYYPTIVSNLQASLPQTLWTNATAELGKWGTGIGWLGLDSAHQGSGSSSGGANLGQLPDILFGSGSPLTNSGPLGGLVTAVQEFGYGLIAVFFIGLGLVLLLVASIDWGKVGETAKTAATTAAVVA